MVIYKRWKEFNSRGTYFVSRINKNAKFETIDVKVYYLVVYVDGGLIRDNIVELSSSKTTIKLRLFI